MTELLAPAGSVEALHSAVNAGCDAVYIGGKMFGARAYADNPDRDELLGAIDHCHIFDKKIYLTVNTLLKNDELEENLYNFLRPYYEEGLDGVIVSDPGVMKAVSFLFPGLPIHISTQASVTNADGAAVITGMVKGVTRVVPARELTIEEIETFKKNTDLEVEVFVHGAMCVSYSGQCLMSSMAGGRSGNRGRCAQPCRKIYDTGISDSFILSCKDMCTIPGIGRLMRAGVDSFKIEGRMKSPIYVAATVAAYRKYMDIAAEQGDAYEDYLKKHAKELENDTDKLREIYNRGGFCSGFLFGEKNLISHDKSSHNGVLVGRVVRASGREANIVYDRKIGPGDVLEIRRDDGSVLYEYTSGNKFDIGSKFSVLVQKGSRASAGQRVYRVKNSTVINEISEKYINNPIKRKIGISFEARSGMPLQTEVWPLKPEGCLLPKEGLPLQSGEDVTVSVCGACPEFAKTAYATEENIRRHLLKSGDSLFEISESQISVDNGLFIPVGAINTLRREALDALAIKLINRFKRNLPKIVDEEITDLSTGRIFIDGLCKNDVAEEIAPLSNTVERHALVTFDESLAAVLEDESITRIYLPLGPLGDKKAVLRRFKDISEMLSGKGRELYISLPYICRNNTLERIGEFRVIDELSGICGFLVRNNEELSLFKNREDARIILDHTLHVFNRVTASTYGVDFTYSPELNREELVSFGTKGKGELIVYGRLPLMQTAHCVYRNEECECHAGKHEVTRQDSYLTLKDGKGYVFPVIRRCEYCTNIILNSSVLDLRELENDINDIKPRSIRYEFTTEKADEIRKVLQGSREEGYEYTYGHFKRGVL